MLLTLLDSNLRPSAHHTFIHMSLQVPNLQVAPPPYGAPIMKTPLLEPLS